MLEDFAGLVPAELYNAPGSVFYSGRSAWNRRSPLYLLGENPHGKGQLVEESLNNSRKDPVERSSAYTADWGWGPGNYPFQKNVRHLCDGLGIDPPDLPASNLVFVASSGETEFPMWDLAEKCWPFHCRVISELGVECVICLGVFADSFVCKKFSATQELSCFEAPERKWRGWAHKGIAGPLVVGLEHPSSRGPDWLHPESDPIPWLKEVYEHRGSPRFPMANS